MHSSLLWVRPTVRSMRVVPLAVAVGVSGSILVALDLVDADVASPWSGPLVLALVASAVVLGLHDPAHALLAALPSGTGTQLLHRLTPLSSLAVGGALVLDVLARDTPAAPLVASTMLVLTTTAVAAHVATLRRRPDVAASVGAAVPAAWAAWAAVTTDDGPLAPLAHLWHRRPTTTAGAALVLAVAVSVPSGRHIRQIRMVRHIRQVRQVRQVRQKSLDPVNRRSRSVAQRK